MKKIFRNETWPLKLMSVFFSLVGAAMIIGVLWFLLFEVMEIPIIRGLPSFSEAALAEVISDDTRWDDNLVLYYTASDGEKYRMLCDYIFVAGPYTVEDVVPLSMEGRDFNASYQEVKDQVIFSEWWDGEHEYPVVHALQLRKIHGQVISVSRRYLVFQECGLATATDADIAAYLDEHPLQVEISLSTDQEDFGCITGSHTEIPE